MNKKILTIFLSLIIVALAVYLIIDKTQAETKISKEETINKALEYIQNNLATQGMEVALAQVYESEENPLYYTFQISALGQLYDIVVTADGSKLFMDAGIDLNKKIDAKADGNFSTKEDAEIITEDGKLVVYLFTSSTCPHCEWEKPVVNEVISQFGDNVILKLREDTAEDQEVYTQFGTGGVPLLVIGGKYYREGSGENFGKDAEKEYLTKYICELTGNTPEDICIK